MKALCYKIGRRTGHLVLVSYTRSIVSSLPSKRSLSPLFLVTVTYSHGKVVMPTPNEQKSLLQRTHYVRL